MRGADINSGAREYGPYEFPLGDELRGERATLGKSLLDVQRDLRIKAAYIAAIEDAKIDAFPNPSFVAGYVRSYARYLGLDPDEVFHRFCQESSFVGGHGAAAGRPVKGAKPAKGVKPAPGAGGFRPDFPMARPSRGLPEIPIPAIGSLVVLVLLVAGLGYGGWTVLENIQRVQFAPVDDLPLAVSEVDPLDAPEALELEEPMLTELASPVAATALADLYRQQALEVPILVPRDGPIAALDPDRVGLLAGQGGRADSVVAPPERPRGPLEAADAAGPAAAAEAAPTPAAAEATPVMVVTERAAWVRVYLGNGTIIFERILEKGESYSPPEGIDPPLIWAGNSGSVYVRVGAALHGPLGSGTRAVRDVPLDAKSIADRYPVVEDVPEVISQSTPLPQSEAGPVEIR
jgi:hypothetical protein